VWHHAYKNQLLCSYKTQKYRYLLKTHRTNRTMLNAKYGHFLSSKTSNHVEYKLKRCSKKECCKQCRHLKFKDTMKNWPAHKQTHRITHRTPKPNRHSEKAFFFGFLFFILFFNYNFVNDFSKKCLVTLVRSMNFIEGLNQFSAKANLTLFQLLMENKMKIKYVFTPST